MSSEHHEAIEIAGKAYNGRTLEPYPVEQGGEFCSLMKPLHFDRLQPEALKVNGKTVEELEKAPEQALVWRQFIDWVARFNPKKSNWTAPISSGKNIRAFDCKFADALNKLHGPKKEKTVLFNPRLFLDLEDIIFLWFENESEPVNQKMDTLRDFFGLSHTGAHSALTDVRQTGDLVIKFLQLHRSLQKRQGANGKLIKFKDSMRSIL